MNKRAGFRMVTTALVLLALPVTARGMDKAQLVDLILKDRKAGFESKAAAERAFDAVVDAIREGVQKDGKVQIIGFGVYTVRKASASTAALAARSATEVLGTKKKVKLHYRSGKNAGVMVAGTNGLYDVLLEVPTGDYLTRPLEVEMKLPKPLSPKIVELTMGLPESDPQLDALLADPGAFPLVVELGLPGWVFDGVPPDPNALDYYGEMFGGFHTDVGVDPCAERLLAERLGLGGVELCPPGDCGLTDPEVAFDALAAVVAAASGNSVEQARGAIDVLLAIPYEPPPGLPIDSVDGMGTFAIEQRPDLKEIGGDGGKRVKIKAKHVLHFQGGAAVGPRLDPEPPSD